MKTSFSLAMMGGLLLLALSQPVLARGGGGAGGGGGGGFSHGSAVGPGAGSAAGANANGRFAADRDKGLERAQDRMSEQGLTHQKTPTTTGSQQPQSQPGVVRPPAPPSR